MFNRQAITLVEMIVVVSILSILWTVWLISYSSNLPKIRDAARIASLTQIKTGLDAYKVKWPLPIPDHSIEIRWSGSVIWYQGEIGENTLKTIGYNKAWFDPDTELFYDYYVSKNGKFFQLMSFLEKQKIEDQFEDISFLSQQASAADIYTLRYPKVYGDSLWILTDQDQTPVNKSESISLQGSVDLLKTSDIFSAYFSDEDIEKGNKALAGKMFTLTRSQRFGAPKKCPMWFIPVDGNKDLWQPGFCVAKYEMSLANGDGVPDNNYWNSYSYASVPSAERIPTITRGLPLTNLTISEAITACRLIGTHLITNLEWMTIARDLEKQGINWTTWEVNNGYIYNGNSANTTYWVESVPWSNSGVDITWGQDTPDMTFDRTGNDRRQLMLWNGEIIWDFSGNVFEFVNKTNNIDDDDGINEEKFDMITNSSYVDWEHANVNPGYRKSQWPSESITTFTSLWKVYEGSNTSNEYLFLRWGRVAPSADTSSSTNPGIYALNRLETGNYAHGSTWFRCAK